MSDLAKGPGIYATFVNIDTPDVSIFEPYLKQGLKRLSVFTFVPKANLPTTPEWFTTKQGKQPQGLNTNGGSTVADWQGLLSDLAGKGVQIGFTFGGEGATGSLGTLLARLNADATAFQQFVQALRSYNVSFLHFDIEGTWNTPPDFSANFQAFAENLQKYSDGDIAVQVGASAPVGTVDGANSGAPAYLTPQFVQDNHVYFNVYTYYTTEVDNVLADDTPWIPSDTDIPPDHILFSVTASAADPPEGQISFADFTAGVPGSYFLKTVQNGYLGITSWIWWENDSRYPAVNLEKLFSLTVGG